MSLLAFSRLAQNLFDMSEALPFRGDLRVDELRVELRGDCDNLRRWFSVTFGASSTSEENLPAENFVVTTTCSDAAMKWVIELNDSASHDCESYLRCGDALNRLTVGEHRTIDYFPRLGCAWLTDRATKTLSLVYASRMMLPTIELRFGIVDVINQYRDAHGWHVINASAIRFENKGHLVIGPWGTGKTTLLANLLKCGGTLIGDERIFVRARGPRVEVRASSETVDVSLRTATQFDALRPFVLRPDRLECYQSEFEPDRVWSTSDEDLGLLPDRLKLLPIEFAEALGDSKPEAEGQIDHVIVPRVELGLPSKVKPISHHSVREILARALVIAETDQEYPRWLLLGWPQPELDPHSLVRAMQLIPARELQFSPLSRANSVSDKVARRA